MHLLPRLVPSINGNQFSLFSMNTSRLTLSAALLGAASLLPFGSVQAQTATATTTPVGYITLSVAGTNGTAASALSFLGLGMVQPSAFQGNLESASGSTIVDNDATWTDNQYNGANGGYYVELTSGTGVGLTSQITATSGSGKSLTLADNLSAYVTNGVTYTIRKNWTLAALFGAKDESGLGGGSATTADQVLVYNSLAQAYTTYYYKSIAFPPGSGTGWRTTASSSVDVSTVPFNPYDGILIRRYQSASLSIPLVGAVKTGTSDLPLNPGLNILSNVYPSGTFTLGTCGLYTGNSTTGLAGGSSTTADQVQIYDQTSGTYSTYYYKTSAFPPGSGTGWRSTASTTSDASTTPIPFGASILIQRTINSAFEWVAPQPFTL